MNPVRIFSDSRLTETAERLLREGVAPHELIRARRVVASVLAKGDPDPRFLEAEVAFGQPDLADVERSERLRWLHLSSAGYTRYDTDEFRALARRRGLRLTTSSQVYAQSCAEHVFAFLLAQARGLVPSLRTRTANGTPEWEVLRGLPRSPSGQDILILGYGSIAEHLVRLLEPFHARILAFRRQPKGDERVPIVSPGGLADALGRADHVVDILPDNPGSRGFFDAARFASMKRGAIFYNIGRGTTVDQTALAGALRSGHVGAAWLDVTDPEPLPEGHPLLAEPNCHITPHTAGGHHGEAETSVRHFLANLRRWETGNPLVDEVNIR
jgi:phosphoglycerate dehydrogenase-like enzyme